MTSTRVKITGAFSCWQYMKFLVVTFLFISENGIHYKQASVQDISQSKGWKCEPECRACMQHWTNCAWNHTCAEIFRRKCLTEKRRSAVWSKSGKIFSFIYILLFSTSTSSTSRYLLYPTRSKLIWRDFPSSPCLAELVSKTPFLGLRMTSSPWWSRSSKYYTMVAITGWLWPGRVRRPRMRLSLWIRCGSEWKTARQIMFCSKRLVDLI